MRPSARRFAGQIELAPAHAQQGQKGGEPDTQVHRQPQRHMGQLEPEQLGGIERKPRNNEQREEGESRAFSRVK